MRTSLVLRRPSNWSLKTARRVLRAASSAALAILLFIENGFHDFFLRTTMLESDLRSTSSHCCRTISLPGPMVPCLPRPAIRSNAALGLLLLFIMFFLLLFLPLVDHENCTVTRLLSKLSTRSR